MKPILFTIRVIFTLILITFYSSNCKCDVNKDSVSTTLDRHILISVGGGYFDTYSFSTHYSSSYDGLVGIIGLEYPLDKDRDWNLELGYYQLFKRKSNTIEHGGLLTFRRYIVSQENRIRTSFHIGLGVGLDVGLGLDYTIIPRLLYTQVCARKLFQIIGTHNDPTTPFMITLGMRVML